MKTPHADQRKSRHGFLRAAAHAGRLAVMVLLLTASGCPVKKREQEGDLDVKPGVYQVTVTPDRVPVAPPSLNATVADIPVTVSAQCLNPIDPTECDAYMPGWTPKLLLDGDLPGLSIRVDSPNSPTTSATIVITDLPRLFPALELPSSIYGNSRQVFLFFRPSRALPSGLELRQQEFTLNVVYPGSPERHEAAADRPRLSAARDITLVPGSGNNTISSSVTATYTGQSTILMPLGVSGSNPDRFSATSSSAALESSHGVQVTVTFTALAPNSTEYKAQINLRTLNGATAVIHCTGHR